MAPTKNENGTPLSVQRSCSVRFQFAEHYSGRKTLESDRCKRNENWFLVPAQGYCNRYKSVHVCHLVRRSMALYLAGTVPVEGLEMLRRQSIRRRGACMPVTPRPFPRQTPSRRFRPAACLTQTPFRREFKTAAPVSLVVDLGSHVPLSSPWRMPSSPITFPSFCSLLSFTWSRSARPAKLVQGDSRTFTSILDTTSISLSIDVLFCSFWYGLLGDQEEMEGVDRTSEGIDSAGATRQGYH